MARMTPELDRLAAARPESARHAGALTDEGERQALLAAIMADEQPQHSRRRHHRRLMPSAAAAMSALAVSRRHRQIAFAAVAVTVAAGAALAVTALTPAGHEAGHQSHAQLAAWTVSKLVDGNISVTVRELKDPAGLQARLRADGVPASVTFTSQQNPACRPYPGGTPRHTAGRLGTPLLDRVFPKPYQELRWSPGRPDSRAVSRRAVSRRLPGNLLSQATIVIDPSALPGNAGVQIATVYGGQRGVQAVDMPTVVYASPRCTGS
jgi:hypothetical protein